MAASTALPGAPPRAAGEPARIAPGFTLVELLLSLLIVAILATIALASYGKIREQADLAQAKTDISIISTAIERYYLTRNGYPDTLADVGYDTLLDPWGNPYQYLNITTVKGNGKVRKDHNLVPLNSDFDLYSMGKDGASQSPLTAKASRDDIVRAHDGAFVGLASDY